jgi:hypothetical protein
MTRKPFRPKIAQLKLRMPEALRGHLERVAARNGQSMNAEILQRLQNSFRAEAIQEKDIHTRVAETLLEHLDPDVVHAMWSIMYEQHQDDEAASAYDWKEEEAWQESVREREERERGGQ